MHVREYFSPQTGVGMNSGRGQKKLLEENIMLKRFAIIGLMIVLISSVILKAEERIQITWKVELHSINGLANITTYYKDNTGSIYYNSIQEGNESSGTITRTMHIWPGQDPPPALMCVEGETEHLGWEYYDKDSSTSTSPAELEIWLGVDEEDPGDPPNN